jgi:hypothetical protein
VIGLLIAADLAAADAGSAQNIALDTYRTCVTKNADGFRKSDLTDDQPVIVVDAAAYTRSTQRADLIGKAKQFSHARHPDLSPAGLGKITAMFIEKQDSKLEQQLVLELGK